MKVLLTAKGLLGYAIKQVEKNFSDLQIIEPAGKVWDLTKPQHAELMIESYRPDVVILNAAKVGGVKLNSEKPEDMFYTNSVISANVIHASAGKVSEIIAFGSSCAYEEKETELKEGTVMNGLPYPNNDAYAWAKRMTLMHLEYANRQYKTKYSYLTFGTMYGQNDYFNLDYAHVIPSLIYKCYLAKKETEPLRVWGDGSAVRDVIYSQDAANVALSCVGKNVGELIVSAKTLVSVKEMVKGITKAMKFKGNVCYGNQSQNAQVTRPKMIVNKMNKIFPNNKFTPFEDGVKETCDWFLDNYPNVRV